MILKGFIESLVKQMEDKKARLQELQTEEKASNEKQNQLAETLGTINAIDQAIRGKV